MRHCLSPGTLPVDRVPTMLKRLCCPRRVTGASVRHASQVLSHSVTPRFRKPDSARNTFESCHFATVIRISRRWTDTDGTPCQQGSPHCPGAKVASHHGHDLVVSSSSRAGSHGSSSRPMSLLTRINRIFWSKSTSPLADFLILKSNVCLLFYRQ